MSKKSVFILLMVFIVLILGIYIYPSIKNDNYQKRLISDIYKNSVFKENYGWQISDVEKFDNPIKVKGHLSLWEYNLK